MKAILGELFLDKGDISITPQILGIAVKRHGFEYDYSTKHLRFGKSP